MLSDCDRYRNQKNGLYWSQERGAAIFPFLYRSQALKLLPYNPYIVIFCSSGERYWNSKPVPISIIHTNIGTPNQFLYLYEHQKITISYMGSNVSSLWQI